MLGLPLEELEVLSAGQIVEDPLDSLLVHRPRVCTKACDHNDGKYDVWVHGEHGPV
jgi:hypothetical protein